MIRLHKSRYACSCGFVEVVIFGDDSSRKVKIKGRVVYTFRTYVCRKSEKNLQRMELGVPSLHKFHKFSLCYESYNCIMILCLLILQEFQLFEKFSAAMKLYFFSPKTASEAC